MPRLFNHDHQAHVVDPDLPAIQPGESHEFTDEQVNAGLTGIWKQTVPRKGLPAQIHKEQREHEQEQKANQEASEEDKPDAVDRKD